MQSFEERVVHLEEQMSEQSHAVLEVRYSVRHLEHRLEVRFDALEQRMDARLASTERRVDSLEDKVSRQFIWTVGVQVTTFVAIVAALLSRG